ncbi:DUF4350 domain-containing protein [Streptomyces sp. NPDC007088]|uniref:DUF4350 domain-containing protein n=1 Tax=Streptomyces sp. NPDC007088 TaxID=3364773 RepID=UPI0036BC204D
MRTTGDTVAPSSTPSGSTPLNRSPRQIWTRNRGLLIGFAILLVAALAIALARSGAQHGRLDPRSADPQGSRAVAELLKDRNVTTRVVTTLAEARAALRPDSTLLVARPDALSAEGRTALRRTFTASDARTVLVAPTVSTRDLLPDVTFVGTSGSTGLTPSCDLPQARRAGPLSTGGLRYSTTRAGADLCYLSEGTPTVLRLPNTAVPPRQDVPAAPGRPHDRKAVQGDTVVLGAAGILANDRLDERGNASLALQLLGSRPHLVWYLPSADDPGTDSSGAEGNQSFFDLIPSGWRWGTLQLGVAALLTALWRSRRLGPLVEESLPVAVRASETVEGRARLYRKADARDRAAQTLRAAARARLAAALGLPAAEAHLPETLLPPVEARLRTSAPDTLAALLFGPPPTTDLALVTLADRLDALEREVRTS